MSPFLNFNPFTSTRSWLRQGFVGTKLSISHLHKESVIEDRMQMLTAINSLLFHSRLTLSANKIHVSSKYQIHTCQGHANFSCIIPSQTTVMFNPQERSNCSWPSMADGRTRSVDLSRAHSVRWECQWVSRPVQQGHILKSLLSGLFPNDLSGILDVNPNLPAVIHNKSQTFLCRDVKFHYLKLDVT